MRAPVVTLKLPYVYSIPDRHGNDRLYFWRGKGHPRVRLRETPGTTAFHQRYEELLKPAPATGGALKATPRTWRWLLTLYFASAEFQRLNATTQSLRRRILESTCAEPVYQGAGEKFADFPLDRLASKAVRVLRDRKAKLPHAANNRLKAIRYVFKWAMEAEHLRSNPARDVALIRAPSDGHHTWTLEELERFEARHSVGTKARLALDLLMYTGSRRSDVVRLGRQHVREGWLRFTQVKTKTLVELPILPGLQRTLDASPTGDLTFLVTDQGKGFTAAGFGNKFRDWCNEAGLPQCSAHGLRKAAATRAAENGATANQLMAMFGWLNLSEAERYTKAAERKKLAGAALVFLKRPEAKEGT
jgi:site-specific recombinase XerD